MKTKLFFSSLCLSIYFSVAAQSSKPNFLFIIVDDLNDYVEGFNGHPQTITPSMYELEQMGVTFLNGYCNSPGCAPSRTSMLSGKDLKYTKVYINSEYDGNFREEFTAAKGNEEVFTLPEVLKANGYYTYGINKIFHSSYENDYDDDSPNACAKELSWNKMIDIDDPDWVIDIMHEHKFGDYFSNGSIPDSLEKYLMDYAGADSAIAFLNSYASGDVSTCGNPFFLALGIHQPHEDRYIPEKYYPDYYKNDFLDEPFHQLYNNPPGEYPYNGIVMPPQPAIQYGDYFELPEGGLAQQFADGNNIYEHMQNYVDGLTEYPFMSDTLTDIERKNILYETVKAGYLINYLAAVRYADAQIGRVINALQSNPDLLNNTVIILVGDNGYSLGEKRHWSKWTLWEPDTRIPFIVVHPGAAGNKISNKTVSLLDLFPTICKWAGTELPTFSDGSDYVDGIDFSNLVINPELHVEKPILSSYKKKSGPGSCFPHHSVRNERFHYIRYRSNNNGLLGTGVCNASLSITEEELYEVGENRQTDPNEWNNLITDPDYEIVKKYLRQWLPDSSMYLKKTYTVRINEPHPACYYKSSDIINLNTLLYNANGTQLFSIPTGKKLKWWTNLDPAVTTTFTYNLNLSSIPAIASGAENELKIYLALYNSDFTVIEGFDMITIHINNVPTNYPLFKVKANKKKVTIKNIVYPAGTFTAIWDFGDGTTFTGLTPPPHAYLDYGTYIVSCSAVIESADGCTRTKKVTILLDTGTHIYFKLSPNPASSEITVSMENSPGDYQIDVYDAAGIHIMEKTISTDTGIEQIEFDTRDLPAGIYYVQIKNDLTTEVQTFVKAE